MEYEQKWCITCGPRQLRQRVPCPCYFSSFLICQLADPFNLGSIYWACQSHREIHDHHQSAMDYVISKKIRVYCVEQWRLIKELLDQLNLSALIYKIICIYLAYCFFIQHLNESFLIFLFLKNVNLMCIKSTLNSCTSFYFIFFCIASCLSYLNI